MRLLWRLARRPYADLTGEGARLHGGRWNSPGRPVLYLSENAALTVLEVRVYLDLPFDLLPPDYVLMGVEIPPGLACEEIADPDWRRTRDRGDRWLAAAAAPLLRAPSALVPESFNILVNPRHPAIVGRLAIGPVRPFRCDARLWGHASPRPAP